MVSTALGYLAIKKQASRETGLTPDNFIRFNSGELSAKYDNIVSSPIQNNRHKSLHMTKGKATVGGNYDTDLDFNESPWFFYGVMGSISSNDISSATDGSVYQHTITLANELPAFSIEQAKGNTGDSTNNLQNFFVNRGFGCLIDQLTVQASDGIVKVSPTIKAIGMVDSITLLDDAAAGSSVDLYLETVEGLTTDDSVNIYDATPQNETDAIASISTSNKTIQIATLGNSYTVANDAKVELVAQTPSYSLSQKTAAYHHVDVQFGANLTAAGSASESNIEDRTLTFSNNIDDRYGSVRRGASKLSERRWTGMVDFTLFFESKAEFETYRKAQKTAMILTISNNEIVSATDTNNAKYQVQFKCSDVRYTEYDMPTGEDDVFAVSCSVELLYDSSDAHALQIVVNNAKIGTYYTATS